MDQDIGLLEAIDMAMEAEVNARDFYQNAVAKVSDERGRDLLQQLAESTTGRARLPVELEIQGEEELPPEVKVVFYRIAQEALNNVSKHANASQVLVRLSTGEAGVDLRIIDDGQGFELDEVTADHLGLRIMEERAETIGAELNVRSSPGEGTAVGITWRDHGGLIGSGGEV